MPTIQIGFPGDPQRLQQRGPNLLVYIAGPSAAPFSAMVDTGATSNCIDPSLAKALTLDAVEPIDEWERYLATGDRAGERTLHTAHIFIPALNIDNQLTRFHTLNVMNATFGEYQLLLGRRFLIECRCRLFYNGRTGSVFISNDP